MTTTPTPGSRDRSVAAVHRLTIGGALAGMTLTGALAGALAQADAAAAPPLDKQPASTPAAVPAMPRRTVVIVDRPGVARAGARPAAPTRKATTSTVQAPAPAPAPAVKAPQKPVAPAARSTGSSP